MASMRWVLLGVTLAELAAGGVVWSAHPPEIADACWTAGAVSPSLAAERS